MNSIGGYNPLRWICKERGLCWNKEHRPNIEYFTHYLPRKISMMDVDATVEVNGNFLFMEFKSPGAPLLTGQRIYFQRITSVSKKITVVVVEAVCRTMEIRRVLVIANGKIGAWQNCDLEGLCSRVEAWAARVDMGVVGEGQAA